MIGRSAAVRCGPREARRKRRCPASGRGCKRAQRPHTAVGPPKLITLNNELLAVVHPLGPPDNAADAARFGAWAENACLAHAWNSGQSVTYWREEPLEVDGVFDGPWGKWAVEVKTGTFRMGELAGLLEFVRRYPAFKPLILCGAGARATARLAEVQSMSWQEFLLDGPPSNK